MAHGRLKLIALLAFMIVVFASQFTYAGTIYSENFNAATASGGQAAVNESYSELWKSTNYYWTPSAANWTFNGGALLAINGVNTADHALLLNEGPEHAFATNTTSISGLIEGKTYVLSFDHWGDNRTGSTYSFDVSIDNLTQTITRQYVVPGPGMTEYLSFVATASTVTLTFTDKTYTGQGSAIIDNIAVRVPEPSLVLLLGLGIGAACAASRKFKA